MEEKSLVESLLANVYDLVGKKDLDKVKCLRVTVGPQSSVNPLKFKNNFHKKVTNTALKQVPLELSIGDHNQGTYTYLEEIKLAA
ncbi:MAG: hypothetical protein C4562_06580 [Actinobacteria bacterium]|nr:MAG: hypothetical protein C4562_06580 [Actinomycetota bacterium]